MSPEKSRPVVTESTGAAAKQATVIMTRPGDGWRARRLRKFARRELDALLGCGLDPWRWSEPVGDVFAGGRLDLQQRQYRGEDLRLVGWAP